MLCDAFSGWHHQASRGGAGQHAARLEGQPQGGEQQAEKVACSGQGCTNQAGRIPHPRSAHTSSSLILKYSEMAFICHRHCVQHVLSSEAGHLIGRICMSTMILTCCLCAADACIYTQTCSVASCSVLLLKHCVSRLDTTSQSLASRLKAGGTTSEQASMQSPAPQPHPVYICATCPILLDCSRTLCDPRNAHVNLHSVPNTFSLRMAMRYMC